MMAILSLQVADFVLPMQEFEVPTTPLSDDDLHAHSRKVILLHHGSGDVEEGRVPLQ